ncbi:MAG: ABC transporter ATP-binding protein [Planctomycetes bacterium]|nr:ABC transporter ATP-binding protein [Planctomycetota bacterium]
MPRRPLTRSFHRPLRLLRRHWVLVTIGMLLVPVHAGASLWMPRLLGEALDQLTHGGTRDALAATCWALLLLAAVEGLSRFVSRKTLIDASRKVEQQLKDDLTAHLMRLPIAWFDRARTGDIQSRMTQDVELVRFVMGPILLHGGSTLCLLPAGLTLMLTMNVPVTLASLGAFAALFVAMKLLVPRLHKWSKRSQEAIGEVSQRAQEDFAGVRVVQQFDAVDRERAAMATKNRRFLLANLRLVRLRSTMHALSHSTSGVVMLGVLLVGGHEVIGGAITIGELFQFTGYLGLMTFPLEILGWTIAMVPRSYAAATRIEELFQVEPEPAAGEAPALRCDLEARGLTFTYPGADRPSLQDVSFTLAAGQKLGLVGAVGSGKSTLLALLLRYYEPPPGTLFVDGHDVLTIAPTALRQLFALAPQEPFLFSDTVAQNVRFAGDPAAEADDAALQQAVAAAALDQDLPQLRDGLQTIVGERGVTLSGGQKQRVSLARALLSDRPGLLLDDTLSAVDPDTERRILDGLRRERRGRTVVVASHRLSVVADADLILVFEAGKVREHGDHRALLREGGLYATAWRRQTEARALESHDDGHATGEAAR